MKNNKSPFEVFKCRLRNSLNNYINVNVVTLVLGLADPDGLTLTRVLNILGKSLFRIENAENTVVENFQLDYALKMRLSDYPN